MRKKVLLVLLTVTIVLSIVGCGTKDTDKTNGNADTVAFAENTNNHYLREDDVDKNTLNEMKEALHNISSETKKYSQNDKKGYM